jgi:hypothetical protein
MPVKQLLGDWFQLGEQVMVEMAIRHAGLLGRAVSTGVWVGRSGQRWVVAVTSRVAARRAVGE